MELHLIRHTTPAIDKGICYGQSDIPLENTFTVEFNRILENIPSGTEIIYSSPLTRCSQLACALGAQLNLPVVHDHRIMELNFGDWEMNQWDKIDQSVLMHWMENYVSIPCPNGESYRDLALRVKTFLSDIAIQNYTSAIIVSHAGTIRAIYSAILELPLEESFDLKIEYGGYVHLRLRK